MEFDNKKQASRARLILITIPFILLIGSALPAIFLLIATWIPTIIAGALVIIGWAIALILKLTSVRVKFADSRISVFYHPINPMTSSFNRIEIASEMLAKYEIITAWKGLKRDLVLYEDLNGHIAKYPPISILLCDEEMIGRIREALSA